MLMCSEDDDLSGSLQSLNDQFEEYALLSDVLKAVCSTLGYGKPACRAACLQIHVV